MRRRLTPLLLLGVLLAGCASDGTSAVASPSAAATPAAVVTAPPEATTDDAAPPAVAPPPTAVAPSAAAVPATVPIALTVERRVQDAATDGFADTVRAVLLDQRGWVQAGFSFRFEPQAAYRVVLAEGAEVDALCAPYRTGARFSCQNGPVVALNADRWRVATPSWPGTLEEYRTMLVNHEVGHLLGQHHPEQMCEAPGGPAAVMAQQSKGLSGCVATSWPLEWELTCARRHDEPLAPPYEASSPPGCGPRG